MDSDNTYQQKSIPVMTRISPELDEKVLRHINRLNYRNKSTFVEQAIIEYVNKLDNPDYASPVTTTAG